MAILKGPFIDNNTGNYLYPQTSLDMVDGAENVLLKEDVVDPVLATEVGFPADAKKTGDAIRELRENTTEYIRAKLNYNTKFTKNIRSDIPLTNVISKGDTFSISSGKIVANKACVVEVSASAYIQETLGSYTSNVSNLYIYQNSKQTLRAIHTNSVANGYFNLSIPPTIIALSEGDNLALSVLSQTVDCVVCGGDSVTYLTVKTI